MTPSVAASGVAASAVAAARSASSIAVTAGGRGPPPRITTSTVLAGHRAHHDVVPSRRAQRERGIRGGSLVLLGIVLAASLAAVTGRRANGASPVATRQPSFAVPD